jgi:hypothetical protein
MLSGRMSRHVRALALPPVGLAKGASLWLTPILAGAQPSDSAPLQLEGKIPLGGVTAREPAAIWLFRPIP